MAKLYTGFFNEANNTKISDTDKEIYKYISENTADTYEHILQNESRFQIHMALSELRRGLFNWYTFRPNANILEIGGGYGALTGLFCEKAAQVSVTERSLYRAQIIQERYKSIDNLSIYAGDIFDMTFNESFDYIILTGILERAGQGTFTEKVYADYITSLRRFLKPDGIILAAVDNRYGIRYFAGMKDIHTQKAFDSIRRYPQGNKHAHSFTRQEIDNICLLAGFTTKKIYYPLPDYRFPQLIYTDSYLPEKNLKERLIPYYTDHTSIIFNENIIYDDLVDNKVFPFFANSFLMEATYEGTLDKAVYAAVSTDRGKSGSFATIIYDDNKVIKKPLYKEGMDSARQLCERSKELAVCGLNTVEQVWNGNYISMPYINAPTLSNYIKDIIADNPEEVKSIVNRLWENILKSSDEVSADENQLMTEATEKLPWGPILQTAHIELIPLNCFYDNGEFIYFDQEFDREHYPAKYVLFRALHYIYAFTTNAEKYISRKYFIDKYDMRELWDIFLQEENRFLDEVRKRETHKIFYRWANTSVNTIQENVDRLNNVRVPVQLYQPKKTEQTNRESKLTEPSEKPYKIGYVPGVYDLFHVGHLNLIRRSKERCDYLIVGVLTDELVEYFKHQKPHIPYEERAAIVAAISEVDEVVPVDFHNTVKIDAWHLYHFDCHFSGDDHGADWAKDLEQLRQVGSNMEFFPYTQGVSSTQIKKRLI